MKGISPVLALILLLIIVISVAAMTMLMFFKTSTNLSTTAASQIKTTSKYLSTCLRLDAVEGDYFYLRNCGGSDFNSTIRAYVNRTQACISSNMQNYSLEQVVNIPEGEIKKVRIGCCIPEGTTSLRITSSMYNPLQGTIKDYRFAQTLFFDWEQTEVLNITHNHTSYSYYDYADCINETSECILHEGAFNDIENMVASFSELGNWTTRNSTNSTWSLGICDEGGDPKCGYFYTQLFRTRFYYNPAAFSDRNVWFAGDADTSICMNNTMEGIKINENMYIIMNNRLIGWGGSSYGAPRFIYGDAQENLWCIWPILTSNPGFAEECGMNNITIATEDFKRSGGIYNFYLTGQ